MTLIFQAIKKIQTTWRLPFREKIWLLLLYPYSGLVRVATLILPFRLLSRGLGEHYRNYELSSLASREQLLQACRIGRICELTARHTLWESKCLVQAILAKTLLQYYGIPYVIHFGVKKASYLAEGMKAHAWVKVGPRIIIGRQGHRDFIIVGSFVSPSVLKVRNFRAGKSFLEMTCKERKSIVTEAS